MYSMPPESPLRVGARLPPRHPGNRIAPASGAAAGNGGRYKFLKVDSLLN